MSNPKNYYEILQVDPAAEQEVIEAAYRRLALKYHPDANKNADATLRMRQLNEAHAVLSDPRKRSDYDRSRTPPLTTGPSPVPTPTTAQHNPTTQSRATESAAQMLPHQAEYVRRRRIYKQVAATFEAYPRLSIEEVAKLYGISAEEVAEMKEAFLLQRADRP